MSLVAKGVSTQPYRSRNAPNAFCSSDSFDIRSDTAPIAAPLTRLLLANAVSPAGTVISPVAAAPFAASIVPAARDPKCTSPRNCLPHHL